MRSRASRRSGRAERVRPCIVALSVLLLVFAAAPQARSAPDEDSPATAAARPPEDGAQSDGAETAAPAQPPIAPASDAALDALSAELDAGHPDPFENVNREVFWFNRGVDAVLLDPMTRAYAFVVPPFARQSIRNVFANLNTPATLVNDLLQLEGEDALVTVARFVINTTMGMGGLFDAAGSMGLESHRADFSETLGFVGIPRGPYLVVPLLGPSTVRDGFGSLVDLAMAPQVYVLPLLGFAIVTSSHGMTEREEHFEDLEALRESSIDYYASLRSAYLESRR